jgi:uncharacterized protein (TIRG00374 family)
LLKPFLKIAISVALVVVVLRAFDVKGVISHIARVDALTLVLVFAIALTVASMHTGRWLAVVKATGNQLGFRNALQLVLIGHFFNQTLPSAIGGDAVRIWCAYRAGMRLNVAAASVIVDRAFTLFSLFVLTAAGLPWLFDLVTDAAARWALVLTLIAGIIGFFVFLALTRLPAFLSRWRAVRALLSVAHLSRAIMFEPRYVLPVLGCSIASFCVFSLIVFFLAQAIKLPVTLVQCVLLVPPVILISVLPVSIAGWGLREGAMVVAFGFIHVPAGAAFAVSVLFGLTIAAASLPGALLWLLSGYSIKRVAAEADDVLEAAESGSR